MALPVTGAVAVGAGHHDGTRRQHGNFLGDTGIEKRPDLAMPMAWRAHDDEVVRTEFVLIQNTACRVRRRFQLQDDGFAGFVAVFHFIVAQGIAPGIGVACEGGPVNRHIVFARQHVQTAFQVSDAGKLQPPIHLRI